MLSMKPSKKALARPGRISGQVTVLKVTQLLARKVCEASSMAGLMASTTPMSTMKLMGVKASNCARKTPQKP